MKQLFQKMVKKEDLEFIMEERKPFIIRFIKIVMNILSVHLNMQQNIIKKNIQNVQKQLSFSIMIMVKQIQQR